MQMENLYEINRYILEQVKNGNMDKEKALLILKELSKTNDKTNQDIAVIGMSCRFPEADNTEAYWNNLKNGRCNIRRFPANRRKDIGPFFGLFHEPDEDPYMKAGFLEEIDKFDAAFFRISPREATLMEPYQRLFLETVYEAIDDAGYGGEKIYGTHTGIYVGNDHTHKYKASYAGIMKDADLLAMTGSWTGILASRASYIFNLSGPSMVVDTACSSGLVAVHMACQALKNKECEMAIAGGVNLFLFPLKIGGMLNELESENVSIRAFDKYAQGTVWGEGIASVMLKPLKQAIKDRDNIYAVIKGSAINNDGTSNGITAPNPAAQEELLVKAWEEAGISPETVSYIETHGTGTILGDPIEIKGITQAFARYTDKKQFCGIGSVKTNIGHTVGASGIASLIKVILSMRHGLLPPSLHFDVPNPYINFANSPVYLNDSLTEWEKGETPRRAGVSSFGFSGTNCHVVLEEAPVIPQEVQAEERLQVLTLSAKNRETLRELIGKYVDFTRKNQEYALADVCYTANTGRRHCEYRISITARHKNELEQKLVQAHNSAFDLQPAGSVHEQEKREWKKAANRFIEEFLASGKQDEGILFQLCELYEKGADIDWSLLYQGENRRRINIPTYPFERKRFWLDIPQEGSVHSLVLGSENEETPTYKSVQLRGKSGQPYTETEIAVGQIWGNVLGFDELDIRANFYALGGDSIIAMKIAYAINKLMNRKVEASDLLKYPCIEEFSRYIDNNILISEEGKHAFDGSIPRVTATSNEYLASSAQKRLFILNQLGTETTAYNIPVGIMIEGELDPDRMERAFAQLIHRHEILRTSFAFIDGRTVQRVADHADFRLETYAASADELDPVLKQFVRPFDLQKAPLLRGGLVKVNPAKHLLMIDIHHIVADGSSIAILLRELIQLYEQQTLPELPIQYRDFANWQNDRFSSEEMQRQEKFWVDRFQGELPVLHLPYDYARPVVQSYEGDRLIFYAGAELTGKLNRFCAETEATMFMVLLSAFNVLLAKYSGQEDIIVGSPISGRTHPDVENLIGMFVNTLAFRSYPAADKSFAQLLSEVREHAIAAYENQEYPFEELVDQLDISRDLSRHPLFDVMFVLQIMDNPVLEINGLKYVPYPYEHHASKFDLVLQAIPQDGNMKFDLTYSSKLFKRETMERLSVHFLNILDEVMLDVEKPIHQINMLTDAEKQQVVVGFNQTEAPYEKERTIYEIFERQAELFPERTAVVGSDGSLSYRELNEKANQVARTLIRHGVQSDEIVGLVVERTTDMAVGIMGILKAGGAYLPIDPDYPEERIRYMLEDSGTSIVLSGKGLERSIPFDGEVIGIDDEEIRESGSDNIGRTSGPENLAYIIYTSGSTGNPKGVMIEHHNVINLVEALHQRIYSMHRSNLNIALLAPYVFDASVKQIFASLLLGHVLHIVPSDARLDARLITQYYRHHSIDVSDGTPGFLHILSEQPDCGTIPVKHFVIGGEAISVSDIEKLYHCFENDKPFVTNIYGPTECTVDATAFLVTGDQIHSLSDIPIGSPLQNVSVYILDQHLKPVPVGVAGEIYIAGAGVGRGYLNRPELSAERFIQDVFQPNRRMYRTGDLGRWTEDGHVQFISRIDHQVKIRGFRVETGEIENKILLHEEVQDAVVIAKTDQRGSKYLCAYVVCQGEDVLPRLRSFLKKHLPDFMIPAFFLLIDKVPLTHNGKLDRQALPEPNEITSYAQEYIAPRTPLEETLCHVWKEVLGVEQVGIHHNFFVLGGDSIKAMQAAARAERFGLSLLVQDIFQYQTVAELSECVKVIQKNADNSLVTGEFGLVPLQSWLIESAKDTLQHRNLAFMIYRKEGFGEERVKQIFTKIVEHHDALRIILDKREDRFVQVNRGLEGELFEFRAIDLTDSVNYVEEAEREANRLQESMDLRNGPLLKLGLFKTKDGEHLLIVIHQFVIDHVSWRIILEDVATAYTQIMNKEEIRLQNKSDSFKKWVEHLHEYADSPVLLAEKPYWSAVEQTEVIPLPTDYDSECNRVKENAFIERDLTREETIRLLNGLKETGLTMDAILLSALGLALKQRFGLEKFAVNLGSHGRKLAGNPLDISRTVGRFTAIYPAVLDMSQAEGGVDRIQNPIQNLVQNMDQQLKQVPNQGIGYGILKYLTDSSRKSDMQFRLQPEISFNYMGRFDQDVMTEAFSLSPLTAGKTISGEEIRRYKLNVLAMIKRERLNIKMDYSKNQYDENTISGFMDCYLKSLRQVIEAIERRAMPLFG